MGGFDSTMIGSGSPGGMVQYQTKRPQGKDAVSVSTAAASDGLRRVTLDAEKNWDALQVRFVAASQSGQKTVEGQVTDRDNFLITSRLMTSVGVFRLDTEYQSNRAPFVFGTFYSGGKFWYDRPYVSPQSQAQRQYSRTAFYYDNRLGGDTAIKAWLQHANVRRNETLVGFWDIQNANTLNGYYRIKTSDYQQQDFGLSLDHHVRAFGLSHSVTMLVQQQTQNLDFNGPQSISGYTISIPNPVWPIDLSTLTLRPRTFKEQLIERGAAISDAIDLTDALQLRLGTRVSSVHIDTANNTPLATPTADMHYVTHSEGLSWQLSKENKLWVSRATSFEPVRGQTRGGGYLPPQLATQYELGIKRQTDGHRFTANLFNIQQSNLPATDPADRNYLIPLGGMNAQGITITDASQWHGLRLQANGTLQNVKITTPASSTQGAILPGVPRIFGAFKVSSPERQQGLETWINAIASGKKSADDSGSVYASGYVRWDTGMLYKQDAVQLSAWVQNLFDLRYVQALNAVDNVWQGARRSVWVSASYKY
jgi:iron complex outermembrane recepter protein